LVAAGAIGNQIYRLRQGYVVDFVHVHWGNASFPSFNVADSCITIGAGLIILESLLEARRNRVTT
jgi:signal peptidase II